MKNSSENRRRPKLQITLPRAARLHQLVGLLAVGERSRELVLSELSIGLRTFYRELELLKKCGIKVRQGSRTYSIQSTLEESRGRLPFPDPQLNFAEMAELIGYPGEASRRLSKMFQSVTQAEMARKPKRKTRKDGKSQSNSGSKPRKN